MSSKQRPYFFEEQFPASSFLPFSPPVQRHPGDLNYPRGELEKVHMEKDGYHIFVDVKDFKRNEIHVKTTNEAIDVEGKQEKSPSNPIPRNFSRHFRLPEYYDSEGVISTISDDGILEIHALPVSQKEKGSHRNVATKTNVEKGK